MRNHDLTSSWGPIIMAITYFRTLGQPMMINNSLRYVTYHRYQYIVPKYLKTKYLKLCILRVIGNILQPYNTYINDCVHSCGDVFGLKEGIHFLAACLKNICFLNSNCNKAEKIPLEKFCPFL